MPNYQKEKNQKSSQAGKLWGNLRKIFTLNIGTLLFGILFLYILFSAIVYLTSTHYDSYQVISGPLSRNETYTGLALREETTVASDSAGYVSYYAREGNKINALGPVYSISASKNSGYVEPLSQEDLSKIRSQMSHFANGFSLSNFNDTYSFKYELEGNILQYAGASYGQAPKASAQEDASEEGEPSPTPAQTPSSFVVGGQNVKEAIADGIVLYSKDGYEGKTVENLTEEDFDQNSYQKVDLKTNEAVKAGRDIYTIITNEMWDLLIPLSTKQASRLADRTSIKVKFLKDGISQVGDFEIVKIEDGMYGRITFNKGLIRYASDRFLDIELVTNIQSGLKIPLSSIGSKDFYTIPIEYASMGGNELGFLRQTKNTSEFVAAEIYGEKEGCYYVDKSFFSKGDVLIMNDSSKRYSIGPTDSLEGVFTLNKGYPVFRNIEILDQNEEFAIVNKNTSYGLARYDYIVKDASKVKKEDIIQ